MDDSPLEDAEPVPLRGRRVTVMGLGSFGGGAGAVRFLVARGAIVTLTDLRTETELAEALRSLGPHQPAALHLGGHREEDFTQADLVVVNPGVPKSSPFLRLAAEAGVPLSSEMNLFWQHNRGRVIGVTGSNGKSTTTAMTHALLQAAGWHCWLGGNIGGSLLEHVDQLQPGDWVVLELSSFQLEDLSALQRSPAVAIVTNFSPNHLDRHGSLAAYRAAKQNILHWQGPEDLAVLNQDDSDVAAWPVQGRVAWFGGQDRGNEGAFALSAGAVVRQAGKEEVWPVRDWLTVPGEHNLQNALAAIACARHLGVPPQAIRTGLEGYRALPHRLEFVGTAAGRRFYNDSLATTPESTQVALQSFTAPILLLAGGYDKGVDLTAMAQAIAAKPVKAAALLGHTAARLRELISGYDASGRVALHAPANLADAVAWCFASSAPGDVILLSPGCASFDWFRNFADRGAQFRQLAQQYQAAHAS